MRAIDFSHIQTTYRVRPDTVVVPPHDVASYSTFIVLFHLKCIKKYDSGPQVIVLFVVSRYDRKVQRYDTKVRRQLASLILVKIEKIAKSPIFLGATLYLLIYYRPSLPTNSIEKCLWADLKIPPCQFWTIK